MPLLLLMQPFREACDSYILSPTSPARQDENAPVVKAWMRKRKGRNSPARSKRAVLVAMRG